MSNSQTARGIGPTVGVTLLLAITVVLVAMAGTILTDTSSKLDEPSPAVSTDFSFTQNGSNIIVTHEAGDTLSTDRLAVRGPGEARFDGASVDAGDSFVIETDSPSGRFDLVYLRTNGPDAVLATADNPLIADLGGVPPQITVAYEDLTVGGSDYDYNDWAFDMQTTIAGYVEEDTRHATQFDFEFDPLARGGGYDHDQYLVPDDLGTGEYDLTVFDGSGTIVRRETGEFDTDTEIFLLNSGDAFTDMTNSDADDSCTAPERRVELELTLDTPTEIPDNPIDADRQHGAGLPFNLTMEPSGNNNIIGIGDPRLVTVPTDWRWPTENTHIADAYETVGPDDAGDGNTPVFDTNTWFEQPVDDKVYERCW
jgi:hypothetical protein